MFEIGNLSERKKLLNFTAQDAAYHRIFHRKLIALWMLKPLTMKEDKSFPSVSEKPHIFFIDYSFFLFDYSIS